MEKETPDLRVVISDLTAIKEALSKSNSVFRFLDAGGILRGVLLVGGILIAVYATAFHLLAEHYGSFTAVPAQHKALFWVSLALSIFFTGYLKIRNLVQGVRLVRSEMTLYKLFKEVYTPQCLSVILPYLATMMLAVVLLCQREMTLYLVPVLALLFGLLYISLSTVFYMKRISLLGFWLVATGLLTLFMAERFSIQGMLILTFSAGFILTAISLYAGLHSERM